MSLKVIAPPADISCSIIQTDSDWASTGQPVLDARFVLILFDFKEYDTNNMHDTTIFETGTATGSQEATTLQDTSQTWQVDEWAGFAVKITGNTSEGEVHRIVSNTADTLTIEGLGWSTQIDNTSTYEISRKAQVRIPNTGKWSTSLRLTYSGNIEGIRGFAIKKNNTNLDSFFVNPVGDVESAAAKTSVFKFQKNDIIEAYAYQTSGSSLELLSEDLRVQFQLTAQRGV